MTPTTSDAPLTCDFEGLAIAYDERVLEPRPWTALQSRWAAELVGEASDARLLELKSPAGAGIDGDKIKCRKWPEACA